MSGDHRRRFLLGMSHKTHIFLDSFPDVLTSASVDLQNESSGAAACARASHINTFPQVCLNRPEGIYRHSHLKRAILDALHRTLPGRLFICFKYRVMVA